MGNPFENTLTLDLQRVSPRTAAPTRSVKLSLTLFERVQHFARNPRRYTQLLFRQLCFLYRVLGDPQAPWTARLAAGLSVGYVVSPIQLIPNFIPIIGQLDDVFVIWLAMRTVRRSLPAEH